MKTLLIVRRFNGCAHARSVSLPSPVAATTELVQAGAFSSRNPSSRPLIYAEGRSGPWGPMDWDRDMFDGRRSPSVRGQLVGERWQIDRAADSDRAEGGARYGPTGRRRRDVFRKRDWRVSDGVRHDAWATSPGRPPRRLSVFGDDAEAAILDDATLLSAALGLSPRDLLLGRNVRYDISAWFVWSQRARGAKRSQIKNAVGWQPQRVSERLKRAEQILGPLPSRRRRIRGTVSRPHPCSRWETHPDKHGLWLAHDENLDVQRWRVRDWTARRIVVEKGWPSPPPVPPWPRPDCWLCNPDIPTFSSRIGEQMTVLERIARLEQRLDENLRLTAEVAERLRARWPTDSEVSAAVDEFLDLCGVDPFEGASS